MAKVAGTLPCAVRLATAHGVCLLHWRIGQREAEAFIDEIHERLTRKIAAKVFAEQVMEALE